MNRAAGFLLGFTGVSMLACGAVDSGSQRETKISQRSALIGREKMQSAFLRIDDPKCEICRVKAQYVHGSAPVYIRRVKAGFYNVGLGAIAAYGGSPQVSTFGDSAYCQPASWRRGIVNVACFDARGEALDARFRLSFYLKGDGVKYLYANLIHAKSYTPSATYLHWPEHTSRPRIVRRSIGVYSVLFAEDQSLQNYIRVAAAGGLPSFCKIVRRSTRVVQVMCKSIADQRPVDAAFTLIAMKSSNKQIE